MGKIYGKSVINFISPTCLKILSFNGFNGKIKTPFERTLFWKFYLQFPMTFHEKNVAKLCFKWCIHIHFVNIYSIENRQKKVFTVNKTFKLKELFLRQSAFFLDMKINLAVMIWITYRLSSLTSAPFCGSFLCDAIFRLGILFWIWTNVTSVTGMSELFSREKDS